MSKAAICPNCHIPLEANHPCYWCYFFEQHRKKTPGERQTEEHRHRIFLAAQFLREEGWHVEPPT